MNGVYVNQKQRHKAAHEDKVYDEHKRKPEAKCKSTFLLTFQEQHIVHRKDCSLPNSKSGGSKTPRWRISSNSTHVENFSFFDYNHLQP